jgi:hypothetical protein
MAILEPQKLPFADRWKAAKLRDPALTWREWWKQLVYLVKG